MGSEEVFKKRCIIKKLDFENCIVTNTKTRTRRRKLLRARITQEIGSLGEQTSFPDCSKANENSVPEPTSPVLVGKQPKSKGSQIFSKRKKISLNQDDTNFSSSSNEGIPPTPNSPVFKLKIPKFLNISMSQSQKTRDKILEGDFSERKESDLFFRKRNPCTGSSQTSSQLDDFAQETRQQVHISSVESEVRSSESYSIEVKESSEEAAKPVGSFGDLPTNFPGVLHPSVKKKYKKNGLLDRLQKALSKQTSEKLLWEHREKISVKDFKKVTVVNFWNNESNFILKCQTLDTEPETNFLMVDSEWVPNLKKIKTGSVLNLYPPWQQFRIKESKATALLNVFYIEIQDELREPTNKQCKFESIPVETVRSDPSIFVESLFSTEISEFLF